jgi:hypothetical protein
MIHSRMVATPAGESRANWSKQAPARYRVTVTSTRLTGNLRVAIPAPAGVSGQVARCRQSHLALPPEPAAAGLVVVTVANSGAGCDRLRSVP